MAIDPIIWCPCHRNASEGSVPSVRLSVEDQSAEAVVGLWRRGGPGARGGCPHCGLAPQTLPQGAAQPTIT